MRINNRKSNTNLIKLIAIFIVISFLVSSFKSCSNNIEQEYQTNSYIDNHNDTYDTDTNIDNTNVETTSGARNKFTNIIGNNEDDVTIMVYMIGTDLESEYGMATKDINEMIYGKTKDNINIVLQTGGCSKWNNNVFSNKSVERWVINSAQPYKLTTVGSVSMTSPDVLSDFIRYSADNFPANRYILILWDHGGGSETGYGYDENFPNTASMSPDLIRSALAKAGVKFDFIGFDACLMANLETAIAVEPYADYLIASEESEPGEGWYYTNWINLLDKNTSTPTLTVAKQIVDDYISNSSSNYELTQSVIDLGELVYNISSPLQTFSESTINALNTDDYQSIALARSKTKEFSKDSELDQVDLIDLVNKFDVDGSQELVSAIKSSIKYNKTKNISNAYGISCYFPYSALSKVNSMVEIYDNIDMNNSFSTCVKSFASIVSSGQIVNQNSHTSSSSLFDILNQDDYYTNDDYYDYDYYDMFNDSYNHHHDGYGYEDSLGYGYDDWMSDMAIDVISSLFRKGSIVEASSLKLIDKKGTSVVSLTNDEWNLIDNITINMFIDDGDGYIDLGKDNTFEFDQDGDLIIDNDGTWLTINDHIVSYHFVSQKFVEDNYVIEGYVPAYLNNQRVNLIIYFTSEYPSGIIMGAKPIYENTDTVAKGLIPINDNDEIKFIANYYSYDGTFIDEYQINDPLIIENHNNITINNQYLDNKYVYTYCLTDLYNNNLYTKAIRGN